MCVSRKSKEREHEAFSMRPNATSVWGLKLLVFEAFSAWAQGARAGGKIDYVYGDACVSGKVL